MLPYKQYSLESIYQGISNRYSIVACENNTIRNWKLQYIIKLNIEASKIDEITFSNKIAKINKAIRYGTK